MQDVLDDMEVPSDTCRILNKWASNMAALNASQWKVFTTSLSAAVFDGRLTKQEKALWDHLVAAANILSASYICVPDRWRSPPDQKQKQPPGDVDAKEEKKGVDVADEKTALSALHDDEGKADSDTDADYHTDLDVDGESDTGASGRRAWWRSAACIGKKDDVTQLTWHLREFGWLWEHVKGTDGYPNLHLAQHLPEVLRDYGPAAALTCFPFERMNKNIGEININNRNIERTFSHTWWRLDQLAALPHLTGDATGTASRTTRNDSSAACTAAAHRCHPTPSRTMTASRSPRKSAATTLEPAR